MYLNCKTNFSFRYGTFRTEELVVEAASLGVKTMAITNINNTCDVWDFIDHCNEARIKAVAGVEIRNGSTFLYILLAKNNSGFLEINRFLSQHLQEKLSFQNRFPFSENVFVIYPFGGFDAEQLNSNEFIGVQITEVNKLYNINVEAARSKYVIRHPVTFRNEDMYVAHRLLRAVDKNIVISKQQREDVADRHEIGRAHV